MLNRWKDTVNQISLIDRRWSPRSISELSCDWIISVKWPRGSWSLENSLNNLIVAKNCSKGTIDFHHAWHYL